MSAKLLKGAVAAAALDDTTRENIEKLEKLAVVPCIAVVRLGEREDDLSYERGITKRCEKLGVKLRKIALTVETRQADLELELQKLNVDDSVHGILMFRPLPEHIDDVAVCQLIEPKKDVDGTTNASFGGVLAGDGTGFSPCTARACIEILKYYGYDMSGKSVAVMGRSLVVGRPVAMLLMHENATVTICHTRTKDTEKIAQAADIIVAAVGKAEILGEENFRASQIVLDVGIHEKADGTGLCGDVKFDEAVEIVEAITPVPGGVGSMTTAVLLAQTVEAAMKMAKI